MNLSNSEAVAMVWDEFPRPQHVGLALGGGGARGVAHIGVMEVLAEHQIPIHMIAGCSVGSIVGALYAAGIPASRQHELVKKISWGQISSLSLLPHRLSEWSSLLKGFPMGILDLDHLIDWLDKVLGEGKTFEQLEIPLAAIAADIVSNEVVIMNKGKIGPAIQASCSVPGVFTPHRRNGRLLVDGGIINNLPVQVVRQMGAEYVIGVDLLPKPGGNVREPENILELTITSIYALVRVNQDFAGREADRTITPAVDAYRLLDLNHIDELIAAGRAAAEAIVDEIKADLGLVKGIEPVASLTPSS